MNVTKNPFYMFSHLDIVELKGYVLKDIFPSINIEEKR